MGKQNKALDIVSRRSQEAAQRNEAMQQELTAKPALPTQMSLFFDDVRAIPNYFARTPLFATVPARPKTKAEKQTPTQRTRTDRPVHNSVVLPSPKGFTITYSGEQLDQSDCDVFMQVIHAAGGKTVGEGHFIEINRYEFLRKLDKTDSGGNYIWLKEVIERLQDAKIVLESERYKFIGRLIATQVEDKQERRIKVTLAPEIVQMFSGNEHTLVDWEKRKQISKRINLCKWLQNFICSHAKGPQHHSLENLRDWFGYKSPMRKFRDAMDEAMDELERVGIISGGEFYNSDQKVKWVRL